MMWPCILDSVSAGATPAKSERMCGRIMQRTVENHAKGRGLIPASCGRISQNFESVERHRPSDRWRQPQPRTKMSTENETKLPTESGSDAPNCSAVSFDPGSTRQLTRLTQAELLRDTMEKMQYNHQCERERMARVIRRLVRYADRVAERHPKAVTIHGQNARVEGGIWLAEFDRQNAKV